MEKLRHMDDLTDAEYEAVTREAERIYSVGLTGLTEQDPDEAAKLIEEVLGK